MVELPNAAVRNGRCFVMLEEAQQRPLHSPAASATRTMQTHHSASA